MHCFEDTLSKELERAKLKADRKFSNLEEKERLKGVMHAAKNLDKETKSEHSDNTWLKKQVISSLVIPGCISTSISPRLL